MKWQPITTAPKDVNGFLGWHTVWKVPVAVRFMSGGNSFSGEDCWIEKSLTNMWPLEAFSHWVPIPSSPKDTE